jgi:metal-responsive CopG/Arc/MetJ family transcriptional regulator
MADTIRLTISLPKELADFADTLAKDRKRQRSRIFAKLLAEKKQAMLQQAMIEGYQTTAEENRRFAEEAMPLAAEVWNSFEDGLKPRQRGRKQ